MCIPVEEIEAWFWADQRVVQRVGRGEGKAHASPHQIRSPKEELMRLSATAGGKRRYSQNQNGELAELLDLEVCAARCPAFAELLAFIREVST